MSDDSELEAVKLELQQLRRELKELKAERASWQRESPNKKPSEMSNQIAFGILKALMMLCLLGVGFRVLIGVGVVVAQLISKLFNALFG
jgi:F0F1-type ATP synthase assembly protein I